MAGASREQALALLAATKNHGDLAVKISSFKQVKEILLSMEPSSSSDLFPYIAELHTSPESLVRKCLVELMEELGMKSMERSLIFMPVLLALLKDDNPDVVRQSIISGTNFFCSVLKEISLQFHHSGKVERWFEELLLWMGKFKDVVCVIAVEPGSIGAKLLALKFLEIYVVLFTAEVTDSEAIFREGKGRSFSISHLFGVLPLFDPAKLTHEVNKILGLFLGLLHSANTLQGSLVIAVINCLAGIARKRPLHYSTILSALLDFNPNFEALKGGHTASIRYSVRTAFLGFLRCTNPAIMESRERLIRALRAMNAGDAADQVIRQVDKMQKNTERAYRELRFIKEDPTSTQIPVSGDLTRKKPLTPDADGLATNEMAFKRSRFSMQDDVTVNGVSPKAPLPENNSPAERLITMIGALLAEGERGAQSLEILISNIHPDLMADIVITNMKHLPRSSPPLSSRLGNFPTTSQAGPSTTSSQVVTTVPAALPIPLPPMASASQVAVPPPSLASGISISASDVPPPSNISMDLKRDPRRDPRRFDPRRAPTPTVLQKTEDINDLQCGVDGSSSLNGHSLVPVAAKVVHTPDLELSENLVVPLTETRTSMGKLEIADEGKEVEPVPEVRALSDLTLSPVRVVEQDRIASTTSSEGTGSDSVDASSMLESDQCWSAASSLSASEEISQNLPLVPPYVDLTDVQKGCLCNLAFTRIVEAYKEIQATGSSHTRQALLARLVAQNVPDDEIVVMLQKHIVSEYQHQKGHELAVHVLFDLHSLVISESDEHARLSAAKLYEKFLLAVAMSLRDTLPASDKSFSRLLGEVPLLPDSALRMLEDLCHSVGFDKDARDGDRVTQGLGAVWSLILGRPPNRQACLDIALKCAVHSQDDVRAKAIRLVANKLYLLSYISENIEQFATDTMLSVVDQQATDGESRKEANVGNQETSPSGSQNSEHESDTSKGLQPVSQTNSTVSLSQAQRHMSLFFALCTKKPSLLKIVFDIYGRAPKTVKQTAHRHIPILVRTLASSYHELLHIISDPPQGSENLLMLVLQILTEETTPSADLIATVKHLYETKLKDAAILIPMLSSLSKDEVLPIFPQLLGLPLEKFQAALARILQGSAHTGPALTPTEVLIAIHDISPEKEGVALKKITDACSACFEQRTVFTQQVLAKSLNQLVERTPLPLLFMRTVIQAVDAYPALVDFVMEILSKLVSKQIWRMPKLWVGFLKCASQTAPHSFRVLLQLPSQQLEMALNRHANLRVPLAAHTNQPSIRNSVPRATLAVLGLVNESHTPRSYKPTSLQDTSTSVHGATLT